jgi:hypothetical protein
MRFLLLAGFVGAVIAACGGSSSTNVGAGNDAGANADGGTGTCPQPAPDLGCAGCYGNTTSPECVQGKWVCVALPCAPPPPPEDAGHDSGSPVDASVDASKPSDAAPQDAESDAGNGCAACDKLTQYCEISYGPPQSDAGPSYYCTAFSGCDAGPACSCAAVGPFCSCDDVGGQITVTCPFHP